MWFEVVSRRGSSCLAAAVAIAVAAPAGAEPGDYTEAQTAMNLIFPPGPMLSSR